jgi:hypothetical protein
MARMFRILCGVLAVCGMLAAGFSAGSSAAGRRANRNARVVGYVQVDGAPAGIGVCAAPQGCVTADRVAAVGSDGHRVATVHLQDHRFTVRLVPGRYTLELLGDGKHVHGQVFERQKVRALAHHTAHIIFRFDFPY